MIFSKIVNKRIGEQVHFAEHQSGLKVYYMPKKFNKSYACFATKYGSVDSVFASKQGETPSAVPDGIAHFLEHKLFEKPDGGNAFDDYAKTGGNANAYTSFNLTSYLFSSTSNFFENFDILLDTVLNPHFTDENIAKEQGIIGQEIKMYEDNPDWRVFFNLLESLYVNYPVRKDIAGTVESISHIDKDLLMRCYNTFYHPSNMILYVSGDLPLEKISEVIDEKIPTHLESPEIKRIYPDEPSNVNKALITQSLSVASSIFLAGYKDDDVGYDGYNLLKKELEMTILLEILLGKSSEIYNYLYEKGLINETFSKEYTAEKGYAYSAFGGESKDPMAVREEIVRRLKTFRIRRQDFERAKNVAEGEILRLFNGIERTGNNFISHAFNDINILDYMNVCENVGMSDIMARFERHFNPQSMAISIIMPHQK